MDALKRIAAAAGAMVVAIIPVLAVAQPTTAPATQPAATASADLKQWTSVEYHLRLQYAPQWRVLQNPAAGQAFAAQIPLHAAATPFAAVSLRVDRAAPGPPPPPGPDRQAADRAAMMDVSDAMASYVFNNGGRKVTIRPDMLGDARLAGGVIPARRVQFVTDLPSGPMATIHVVAVKDGIAYVWTVAAPASALDAILPQVQQMLSSFETLQ